jgi:hypothetical protein
MAVAVMCVALMFFGQQGMVVGGGEAGSEFESLNATGQKGDLIQSLIALFVTLLGLCRPCLDFNQKTSLCYLRITAWLNVQ